MRRTAAAAGAAVLVSFSSLLAARALTAPAAGIPLAPVSAPSQEPDVVLQEARNLPRDAAYLGPANCESCHEPNGRHNDEFTWYNTQDGVPGTSRLHKNALNQLADSQYERQSEAFARAFDPNVSDWVDFVYQPSGPCARCHATVVNGYADYGVSCESCHGPAQGYLEPHKEEGNRAAAIAAGLWDIYGKPEVWGAVCMNCHVLGNQALIDAGHPSGVDFDLGVKFQTTALHFIENRSAYTAASIASIGRGYMATIRANLPVADRVTAGAGGGAEPGDVSGGGGAGADRGGAGGDTGAAGGAGETTVARPETRGPVETRVVERIIERPVPSGSGVLVAVDPELQVVDALPPTPAAVVAAVQGRLITVLRLLLNRGATSPRRITPPEDPVPYVGADAQLLRLQQEIIALALEALSKPPRQQQQQ
jgi:hypothetical protein